MATTKSYQDACGMAHALDLVGQRWAMHVVRELMLGPKRYSDLKADLPGISTNVLGDRLAELERTGLVRRVKLPPPAASWVYELTPYGADLEPVITVLGRWGARSPGHRPDLPLSVTSFVLSLRTNVDATRTAGLTASYGLRVDGVDLHARVTDGSFTVEPGTAPSPDATLTGAPEALAGLVYGGRPLDDAEAAGDVTMTGDRDAARRFTTLFTLPEKAVPPPPTP
ncbi:transcriptional regulator [Modestobacter sp. I12A-02628]|uniref:Transcriptional regulator n=1 Tax=Goekera deserti TaxID=2497753 RepID=A0A7K3WBH0_9ACTN|nr:winged helix-turn-helix transcriptional regulator [Goekera deserti]MPQ98854.1 transcriptional regulator [Goekera deserti]NDI49647.1 transcriptional regulator [Goekera deserti]NEL53160.1 transcriptional regulator [Goekera deserti]